MSKFKTMIKKDIEFCNELIERKFANDTHLKTIIGKYSIDYPEFSKGFYNYAKVPGNITNEIENIKIAKEKLEYLLNRADNPELYRKTDSKVLNINASSNNANTISNNIYMNVTLEQIKNNIVENTYLGEKDKEELLEKLNEIEKLQKSNESKTKKWDIAKKILSFTLDKGADIAIMYIPQILKAIQG